MQQEKLPTKSREAPKRQIWRANECLGRGFDHSSHLKLYMKSVLLFLSPSLSHILGVMFFQLKYDVIESMVRAKTL